MNKNKQSLAAPEVASTGQESRAHSTPSEHATRLIEIHVTRKHIRRGNMGTTNGCIIALAIQDAMPLCDVSVGVDKGHMKLITEDWWKTPLCHFWLPKKVACFIGYMLVVPRFMRWLWRPFSFQLEVLECYLPKEPNRVQGSAVLASQASTDLK